MITFDSVVKSLPGLLDDLKNQQSYNLKDLTEGKIGEIFNSNAKIPGIYLMLDGEKPVYVGRSKTLAQRIGKDHRALQKTQATLTYKLSRIVSDLRTMGLARDYMYKNFTVKMIRIDNVYIRTIFEVYASMELQTIHNSFIEY